GSKGVTRIRVAPDPPRLLGGPNGQFRQDLLNARRGGKVDANTVGGGFKRVDGGRRFRRRVRGLVGRLFRRLPLGGVGPERETLGGLPVVRRGARGYTTFSWHRNSCLGLRRPGTASARPLALRFTRGTA